MLIDDGNYKEYPLYINTDLVAFAYLDKRGNIYSNKNIVIDKSILENSDFYFEL